MVHRIQHVVDCKEERNHPFEYDENGVRDALRLLRKREPWLTFPAEAEGIPHTIFVALEGVIAFLFAIDYVLNASYQKRSRDYLLGVWGIIDLIAILPFFVVLANYVGMLGEGELPQWVVFIQGLRILRAIKLFRVVSDTRTENSLGEVIEGNTLHRDMLFGFLAVFSTVAIMEIFGWTNDRHLFWVYIGLLSAVTVGNSDTVVGKVRFREISS
ncbi:MAG: ion transporter [Proteobacteria bacterium]|nr:ion transporter [Pseudomonadota bacterium]